MQHEVQCMLITYHGLDELLESFLFVDSGDVGLYPDKQGDDGNKAEGKVVEVKKPGLSVALIITIVVLSVGVVVGVAATLYLALKEQAPVDRPRSPTTRPSVVARRRSIAARKGL